MPWYLCFRNIVIANRTLKRYNNRLAIVRSAVPHTVILKPNETVTIKGFLDKEIQHSPTSVITHESKDATIPDCVDVEPDLLYYKKGSKDVSITLSNLTTNSATISPREVLCEIQPVQVDDTSYQSTEEKTLDKERKRVVEDLNIDESHVLQEDQLRQLKQLLLKHRDIFSVSDTDIGQCG